MAVHLKRAEYKQQKQAMLDKISRLQSLLLAALDECFEPKRSEWAAEMMLEIDNKMHELREQLSKRVDSRVLYCVDSDRNLVSSPADKYVERKDFDNEDLINLPF